MIRILLPFTLFAVLSIGFWQCKNNNKTNSNACAINVNKGNVVNIRLEAPITKLNPLLPMPGHSRYVAGQLFQTLGTADAETLELIPLLAKRIIPVRQDTNGDFVYDFEIHEAATWDNGTPVTNQDVAFTLKLIFHPLLPTQTFRSYFDQLKSINIDPATPRKFSITLGKYYMLALESLYQIPIYPAYAYDADNLLTNIPLNDFVDAKKLEALSKTEGNPLKTFADAFLQPKFSIEPAGLIGSGPYKLESIDPNQGITLVKKPNWWGDKVAVENKYLSAFPEKLVYRVVQDDQLLENMLKTGELDLALTVNPERFLKMKEDPLLKNCYDFSTRWSPQYTLWTLNLQNPKFSDVRVRKALAQLVDYDYIINTIYQGLADRSISPVNPSKPFYAKDLVPYTLNVQKARDLLTEAGWKDTNGNGTVDKMIGGKLTEFDIKTLLTSTPVPQQIFASLAKSAKQAGVNLVMETVDLNAMMAKLQSGDFETNLGGRAGQIGLIEMYQSFHSKSIPPGGTNFSRFATKKLDDAIVAIRETPDDKKRYDYYQTAQKTLYDEVPEIFICAPKQRYIVSKRFDYVLSVNRPGYYEAMFKLK
jgi:ABC-type transport system substrate-binding protein